MTEKESEKLKKKTVSFAKGTAPPNETPIAVSIPSYEFFEIQGYVMYHIDCWQYPNKWTVSKRYRDFISLHKDIEDLVKDYQNFNLPALPKKRWFEPARWLNRFHPELTLQRKIALQIYLKRLLKIPDMLRCSRSLQRFLEIKKVPERVITDEMKEYVQYKKNNIIRYPPEYDDDDNLPREEFRPSRLNYFPFEGKLLRGREEVEKEAQEYQERLKARSDSFSDPSVMNVDIGVDQEEVSPADYDSDL